MKAINFSWWQKVIQGFILGAAAVAPGLSGSVLAVSFRIYDDLIVIAAAPWKNWQKNLLYLLPLGIGASAGFLFFAFLMAKLFESKTSALLVTYLFLGLMLGSLPSLFKEANSKGFKTVYLVLMVLAAGLILGLTSWLTGGGGFAAGQLELTPILILGCGFLVGVGTIIPGLSASFLLIFLGVYGGLMSAVRNFDLAVIFLLALGLAGAILSLAKIINFFLQKFYGPVYYVFIGIALGSVLLALPGWPASWSLRLAAIGLLSLGGGLAFYLNSLGEMRMKKKDKLN